MTTLSQLAAELGCDFIGDGNTMIMSAASLESACSSDIAFVVSEKFLRAAQASNAGAIIASETVSSHLNGNRIISNNAHVTFAKALDLLYPDKNQQGFHSTSIISPSAILGGTASIGAYSSIGDECNISDDVDIGTHVVVGDNVTIGSGTKIESGVAILKDTVIGKNCLIHSGAVIGADGFGYAKSTNEWIKVPQVGKVVIGDSVEVGANSTVDRGALDDTIIGNRVKIDNQVQVAHNVVIGDDTIIAGCVGIAGSARIGKRCAIGGQAGILGHLDICDDVTIGACSTVSKSIKKPGLYTSIMRVEEIEKWQKNIARFNRLEHYIDKINTIEKRLNIPEGDS